MGTGTVGGGGREEGYGRLGSYTKRPRAPPPSAHRCRRSSTSVTPPPHRNRKCPRAGCGSCFSSSPPRKRRKWERPKMAAAELAALPELVVLRILELLPLRDRLRAARWGPGRHRAPFSGPCGAPAGLSRSRPPPSASSCVQALPPPPRRTHTPGPVLTLPGFPVPGASSPLPPFSLCPPLTPHCFPPSVCRRWKRIAENGALWTEVDLTPHKVGCPHALDQRAASIPLFSLI